MRRLHLASQSRHRPRLDRDDVERPVAVLQAVAGEAAESVALRLTAVAVHVREPAVGIGLPGLEQEVRNGDSGAVVDRACDVDRPGRPLGHGERPDVEGQPDREVRPDGLGRGGLEDQGS